MTDIVEFLRARLDEDEAAASGASNGPWRAWRDKPGLGYPTLPFAIALPGQGSGAYAVIAAARWLDAEHIARHDPARVLADVAAKRQIIEAHPIEHSKASDFTDCAACLDVDSYLGYPCLTIRLLALPHADHADYDPAWRP